MSKSPSLCGICDIRHISKPSEVWCPNCEKGICTECIEQSSVYTVKNMSVRVVEFALWKSIVTVKM
jgi:hypothetical protein